MCPFVFDSPNIESIQKYHADKNYVYTFYDENKFFIVNSDNQIILEGPKDQMPTSASYNYSPLYSIYDEKTNTTEAYLYDVDAKTISKLGTYENKLLDIDTFGDKKLLFSVDKNGKYMLSNLKGKPVLKEPYDKISEKQIDRSQRVYEVEKDGKVGVYDPTLNKIICPVEYNQIDFRNSVLTKDGEFRFFVQDPKTYLRGVVNNKGKVLVPFEYKTSGNYYTLKETDKGDRVWVMKVRHKDGTDEYINLLDENIVASPSEKARIEIDNERSRANSERERAEKEMAEKAKSSSRTHSSRYTEDERIGAAVAASIITGSPIAGLIVNEMMKD